MLAKIFYKLTFTAALSFASLSANADYTFYALGAPTTFSSAAAINNLDQVVGSYYTIDTSTNQQVGHAIYWTNNNFIDLGIGGSSGGNSIALAINDSGQVVGGQSGVGSAWDATLWSNGTTTNILRSNSTQVYGSAINSSGQIGVAGQVFHYPQNVIASLPLQAYISDINNSGQIVGYTGGSPSAVLFNPSGNYSWTSNILESLGGNFSAARSINNSGQVVGVSEVTPNTNLMHAVLWQNGTISDLGSGEATSINSSGQIVGASANRATLWSNGNVIDLNSYLSSSVKTEGWVLNYAPAINDNGSIVGEASNSLLGITSQAFLLQSVNPVPEADTSAMLLMGAGVMGFMARRRKQVAA